MTAGVNVRRMTLENTRIMNISRQIFDEFHHEHQETPTTCGTGCQLDLATAPTFPAIAGGRDGRVVSVTGLGSNPGVARSDGICKYLSCLGLTLCYCMRAFFVSVCIN